MLAGSGIGITGAASTVVRDNLAKNVVLVSNDKGKIAASPLSINSFQSVVTGGATTITDYDLTPNKVVISDAAGKVSTSAVSNIEVGYLAGTNDSIQNQLDSKANQSTTYTKSEVDATKQDALAHYSETSGATTTLLQSFDTASPSIHIAWDVFGAGAFTNVAGSHQELTLPRLGKSFSQPAGTTVYLTVDIKAGSLSEVYFAVHNSTYWFDMIKFQGLGADWLTFTWSFTIPQTTGTCVFGVGYIPTALGVNLNYTNQSSGTVFIRNLHLFATGDLVTISAPLTCQKDLECDQSVLCKHLYADHGVSAEQVHIGGSSLARGGNGELLWDGNAVASEALVTQTQTDLQINLNATVAYVQTNFQGKLATVNESTSDAVILQSLDESNLHIAWGTDPNASYTNQTGFQTITQTSTTGGALYKTLTAQVPGEAFRFSVELKAGTKTSLVILNTDGANFSSRVSFQQSLSNTWQTVVWDYGPTSTGNVSLILGPSDAQYTQSPGTYYLRNLRVTQADIVVNFSQDVAITGQCTAQAFVTSSDERIKGDVQLVDPTQCLQIVKSIPPKIYTRTDLGESEEDPERRIGVIAQDVAQALPAEWKNVVFYQDKSLAVDYSRLSVLLLGAVQSLSTRLDTLETNNLM